MHRAFFLQNSRLGMLVGMFDKMPQERKEAHLANGEDFLNRTVVASKNRARNGRY